MASAAGLTGSPLGLDDLACPICVETIEDAFATPCGHTFCYKCISTHLKNKSNCPSCGAHLVQENIHPNFLLRKLIKQVANNRPSLKTALLQHVQQDLAVNHSNIDLQELDTAIQLLQDRRQQVATHESSNKLQLLLLFLQHAKAKQQGKLSDLEQQLEVLQQDLDKAIHEQQQQQDAAPAAAAAATESGLSEGQKPAEVGKGAPAAAAAAANGNHPGTAAAADAGDDAAVQLASHTGSQGQQQQQQQAGIGGPGSAFRRLSAPIISSQQQQQQQQVSLPQQQQQATSAQQQQQAVGFQPVGFQPVGYQPVRTAGFRPFTPQQQQQAPQQPQLQQQQPMPRQAQQQQQQQQQQGGFRPYGGVIGGLRSGFSPVPAANPQQQQQQQQGFRAPAGVDPGRQSDQAAAADGNSDLNADKKRKILQQFDELQQAYMDSRVKRPGSSTGPPPAAAAAAAATAAAGFNDQVHQQGFVSANGNGVLPGSMGLNQSLNPPSAAAAARGTWQQQQQPVAAIDGRLGGNALAAFSDVLAAATTNKSLKHVAYIPPLGSSGSSSSSRVSSSACNILSTMEFDCMGQLFATAGVQQRICIYDYNAIMAAAAADEQQQQQQGLTSPNLGRSRSPAAAPAGSSMSRPGSTAAGSSRGPCAPLLDLPTRSKISCTSFNPAVQHYLLSSDYEGLVHLWDLNGGKIVRQWAAHDRRIWAVDCCPMLQDQFATGSDDGLVKVWGLREPPMPRLTFTVKVNVCSLEFNPILPHLLAVGSAGHQVHIFDLRNPKNALAALKGHRKAVSYVRWAGADQLVTASTDCTLRLWSAAAAKGSSDTGAAAAAAGGVNSHGPQDGGGSLGPRPSGSSSSGEQQQQQGGWQCTQVFRGHSNSKHFVGLSTHGPYVACGSETNEVFVYHQSLPTPNLKYMLTTPDGSGAAAAAAAVGAQPMMSVGTAASSSSSKSPFVSAVSWRKDSDVLLVANSQGGVWLLSMVGADEST